MPYKDEHKPWKPGVIVTYFAGCKSGNGEQFVSRKVAAALMYADDAIAARLFSISGKVNYNSLSERKLAEGIRLLKNAGDAYNIVAAERREENDGI